MLTSGLVAYLEAGTACNALFAGRYYHQIAPDDVARPFLIYQRVGGDRPVHLAGPCDLKMDRIQITVWADESADAQAAAVAVRKRLHGKIDVTMGTTHVRSCFQEGAEIDRYSEPQSGQPVGLYGMDMTFVAWHDEDSAPE